MELFKIKLKGVKPMNRLATITFLVILACLITGVALAENQPALFGFVWGSSPEKCKTDGMNGNEESSGLIAKLYPGMVSYEEPNPSRSIKGVKLSMLSHNFCHWKLATVGAFFKGLSGFNTLKSAVENKYGTPSSQKYQKRSSGEILQRTVKWNIKGTEIILKHRNGYDTGSLVYVSTHHKSFCVPGPQKKKKNGSDDL